jgi:hypothetical protein
MARIGAWVALILGVALTTDVARANMAPPKSRENPLQITLIEGNGPVTLRVPRDAIAQGRVTDPGATSRLPTMIAGLAMAGAVTLAGLKLVSRRRVGAVAAFALGTGLTLAGTLVFADIPIRSTTQPAQPMVTIPVVVEIDNSGRTVQMALNAEQAARIASLVKDAARPK